MPGTRYSLEVRPRIPQRLRRLEELANDLMYSWEGQVRSLFRRLDADLWERCGHNPKVFLRRIEQARLEAADRDRIFIQDYNRVLSAYDIYLQEEVKSGIEQMLDPKQDLVAYFCAEFGFHESFPIYSGGLGILAGDHCKAASDLGIPFIAVGLLYRQGYFTQTIDRDGNQVAHYRPTDFADLPVKPARDRDGGELRVKLSLPRSDVELRVWSAKAGHITLYLLDSDLPANAERDRSITYQLYGGDIHTRIQQEIVLGMGGVRTLRALGLNPTIWHINEGHSAFQILERVHELVEQGLDFDSAFEAVAAATVFTTHTPVPAGHDIFSQELILEYFADYITAVGVDETQFLHLGRSVADPEGFNQTALALRGSRFHNGVSRIHGGVAAEMERYVWPQIPPEENPIGHVTNGIHVPTFLAREWVNLFDMQWGGGWRNELLNRNYWKRIDTIPDHSFWSLRQSLKADLLEEARRRTVLQYRRNGYSGSEIDRVTRFLMPHETDMLTIGFARRFATYKRATLLFSDPERLARLVNNPERPVLFIFAGKAHPHDQPGQEFIKVIHEFTLRPEFEGRILLIENYDIALARRLVTGVDVWLNNPEYPLEASGTSGQKAAVNGVVNLSVTDGWWAEGYNGNNGWAVTPHGPQFEPEFRNEEEGHEVLDILERQVLPLYYRRDGHGYSEGWVRMSKESMKSILPSFNAQRMVMDYARDYYAKARRASRRLQRDDYSQAREVAAWKRRALDAWPGVQAHRVDHPVSALKTGERLKIEVAIGLNRLKPTDVIVECLIGTEDESGELKVHRTDHLHPDGVNEKGETLYRLDMVPPLPGLQFYKLRVYPCHPLMSHRFELGRMLWL